MKRIHVFEASTGRTFATEAECKEHEVKALVKLFAGLTEENITAAIDRSDGKLADAFERIGNMIADKRRNDGHFKRAHKRKQVAGIVDGIIV